MKPKPNICLLVSFIVGVAYFMYLLSYFAGVNGSASSGAEAVGATLATALVLPHMVCTFIAVLFNGLGVFLRKAPFALVGGILYGISMVLFIPYFFFVLVEMILSLVAYGQMRRTAPAAEPSAEIQ